jgi:hypothetical protein
VHISSVPPLYDGDRTFSIIFSQPSTYSNRLNISNLRSMLISVEHREAEGATMLYINNHQALEAILDGRRHDDGQHIASDADPDEAGRRSPAGHIRQIRLHRLFAVLPTS